ncbi:MAG: Hsp20/alpha crystallin family protein [Bacteroidales bacterium]
MEDRIMLPTIRRRGYAPAYLSDFFDNDLDNFFGTRKFTPAVNIKEDDKAYEIELALPGMSKEDVKIEMEKETLTISSEVKEEKNEEKEGYSRREFGAWSFCRSFRIPENVNIEKISASFKNGILNVALPKAEPEPKVNKVIKIS